MKKLFSQKRNQRILGTLVLLLAALLFFCFKDYFFLSQDVRFENFTRQLFQKELCSNTLNLHYTLAYPQEYGIEDYEISLGTMNPDALKKSTSSLKSLQKKLKTFSPEELSAENRMIYDILKLDVDLQLSVSDHYLLQEPLGPNLGIQAQLPTLLAEYTFRNTRDIKDYFSLLASVPEYFDSILEFEKEKSRKGFYMSDAAARGVMEQCTAFTAEKENNYLYAAFCQRLEELQDQNKITQKQAASYIELHDKLMKQWVFPAYDTLVKGLDSLLGTGQNPNGLVYYPGGKEYYEYLIKNNVGDFRPVKDIQQDLYRQLLKDYDAIQSLQEEDPEILSKAAGLTMSSSYSPKQMLEYLRQTMASDFPSLTVKDYEVKYVPKSMEPFLSPAFYLTPPLDTLSPNTIYINQSSQVSQAELFTTLAHEGFPGHLYQTLYFGGQNPSPIRDFLTCSGYVEGWATYVESISYGYGAKFLAIDPNVMEFLNRNRSVSLCLYSILDIGIHYKGWTLKVVTDTLSTFGIAQEQVCRDIFQYIVENPSNYLKYYLGYLNFSSLRAAIEKQEGSAFDLKEFHQNLLEIGPAPFPIVKKYLLMRY